MSDKMIIERAKSGRSSCRSCNEPIANNSERVGVSAYSPSYGSTTGFYDPKCCIHFLVSENGRQKCGYSGKQIEKGQLKVSIHGSEESTAELHFNVEGFAIVAREAMQKADKPLEKMATNLSECQGFSDLVESQQEELKKHLGDLFGGEASPQADTSEEADAGDEDTEKAPVVEEEITDQEVAQEEENAQAAAAGEEEAEVDEGELAKAEEEEEAEAAAVEEEMEKTVTDKEETEDAEDDVAEGGDGGKENGSGSKRQNENAQEDDEDSSPKKRKKTADGDDEYDPKETSESTGDIDRGTPSKYVAWKFGGAVCYGTMLDKESDGNRYARTSNGKEKSLLKVKDNWWFVDEIPN